MPGSWWNNADAGFMVEQEHLIMQRKLILAATSLSLLAVAGCEEYDPLYRDGLWHPMHVNRTDLTLMAANPADLVRGHGSPSTDGEVAAAAVQRLHDNKVKKLQQAGTSDIKVQSQGGSGE
jgi:molybdopterin biosynthesis enzyme